jgi:hypothetical protein
MSNQDGSQQFQLNLLENGIDFILKGIDELFRMPDDEILAMRDIESSHSISALDIPPQNYKYGVLHLFSGFLLLLKQRLYMHVPELIFKGTLQDIKRKLAKNEIPNTIDFDEIIEKLTYGPRFVFTDSEMDSIRKMQKFRNRFEHYTSDGNKFELWSVVSEFLKIIEKFMREEIGIIIEDSTSEYLLIKKIQFIEPVLERAREVEKRRRIDIRTLWERDINIKLQTLNELRDKDDAIEDEEEEIEFNEEDYTYIECPNCYEESLIIDGEFEGICINRECDGVFPLTTCDLCGEPAVGFSWEYVMCNDCQNHFDYVMSKDD